MAGAVLPVGFYYKAFHGRNFPRWEKRIRAISGLGAIRADASRERTAKRYAFCDVLVVGGGVSGMCAALSAAQAGARVLLVDENARLGGCALWGGATAAELDALIERVSGDARIEVLNSTCAAGYYADHWLALIEPQRMTKLRAGAVVFATGVLEQPAVFRNNDLPGVLLGSAAQRLLHRHSVAPGPTRRILTANREGYSWRASLRARAVNVAAVLDLRAGPGGDPSGLNDLRTVAGVTPVAARAGRDGALAAFEYDIAGDDTRLTTRESLHCDALLLSVGFAPASQLLSQAGVSWQSMPRSATRSGQLPAGSRRRRANGGCTNTRAACGRHEAGAEAAAHARAAHDGPHAARAARAARAETSRQPSHDYPVFAHHQGKEFTDLDEDIQIRDLLNSMQEGFDSAELLKRYSTPGMGPPQGKH